MEYLSNAILSVLDVHAPYKLVRFTKKPAPWLTGNLRFIMHLRDAAKAKFNQTKSVESWEKYKKAINFATQAVRNEKKAFFNHLCKCKDRKQIWKQLQNLNIRKTEQTGVIPDQLRDADSVNEYFINSVPNVSHDNKDFLQYLNSTVYNRLYPNRHILSAQLKAQLCNSIVLSHLTHALPVYAPAIDNSDQYKIQKVQNSCLRFIFGIRKFQPISHTLQQICWLNMKNRSLLNMLTLYHSIILT
nr:unnamed protein product [Callosobruchus chinensis]